MLSDPPFPAGWRVTFDPTTRRTDGGRVLIGGTPLRILRLSEAGARLVDRLEAGEPVPPADGARRLARRLVDAALAHPVPERADPRSEGTLAPVMPGPGDVTVVIPVLDDAEGLARTLAALGPVRHVIVVDDGSADPAAVAAAAEGRHGADREAPTAADDSLARQAAGLQPVGPAEVTVLRHDATRGPAAARNTGWRAATTPLIAFVDADVEPHAGWLDVLLAHLGDESVAAVAPRVRSRDGGAATPGWLGAYDATRSSLDLGADPAPVRPGSRVPYVPTAALVARRTALEAVGGFDEALTVGEDVDLVWRLAAAGHRLRYEPAAGASHPCRPSVVAWLRQRFRYGTAAADLAARHGDAVAPLHVSGWSAAAWGLVGLGHPAAGAALAAGTTVALTPKLRNLDRPFAEAVRIAGLGNLYAGRAVADAARRPWWPAAVALAAVHRRSRLPLAAALVVPPLLERRAARRARHDPSARPGLGVGPYVALRLVDDLAYGTGVLAGCWRRRSASAVRPALTGPFRAGDT